MSESQRVRLSTQLLQDAKDGKAKTTVTLSEHQLTVSVGEEIALSCPVATGCQRHPTPAGDFAVKVQEDPSKLPYYGSYRDENNNVLITDIDRRKDPMPSGAHFAPEPVKFCLELGDTGLLVHSGQGLPGASTQGNIILPEAAAAALFGTLKNGDTIHVVAE